MSAVKHLGCARLPFSPHCIHGHRGGGFRLFCAMGGKRALAGESCLPPTRALQDSSVTRYAVDVCLFVESPCMQHLHHESPVCRLRHLSVFLFSPSLSVLCKQKSIPVHSLCQHLPTSSLFPSLLLLILFGHTAHMHPSQLLVLCCSAFYLCLARSPIC